MQYLKMTVIAGVVTAFGLMSYSWLTGLNDPDIYLYHGAPHGTNSLTLKPGSIVALSPRGNISTICNLKTERQVVDRGEVFTYVYFNTLRADFPEFLRVAKEVWRLWESEKAEELTIETSTGETITLSDPPTWGRKFTGREAMIRDLSEADEFEEPDCESRMAWHLSRGFKACTVFKVLNAAVRDEDTGTLQMRTVAVSFAEYSNFVGPSKFSEPEAPYTDAAKKANGALCDGSTMPWITKLRHKLQVINRTSDPASI